MWPARISTVSEAKIEAKMTSNSTGNMTVKKTEAGLRQKAFWSKRNWWPTRAMALIWCSPPRRAGRSFGARPLGGRGEVEVDVLQRGAGHFEPVELLAP